MGRGLGGSFNCIEKETQEKIAEDLNLALSSPALPHQKDARIFPGCIEADDDGNSRVLSPGKGFGESGGAEA